MNIKVPLLTITYMWKCSKGLTVVILNGANWLQICSASSVLHKPLLVLMLLQRWPIVEANRIACVYEKQALVLRTSHVCSAVPDFRIFFSIAWVVKLALVHLKRWLEMAVHVLPGAIIRCSYGHVVGVVTERGFRNQNYSVEPLV